jgi:transposase
MGAPWLVLRPLSSEEDVQLSGKLADKTLAAKVHERYRVIALVRDGRNTAAAARIAGCGVNKAEHWVHRFNESGFATFEKQPNHPGRPQIINSAQVCELIKVALSQPEEVGQPFTQWSVKKLNAYCRERGLIPEISDEWVRRLLRREGLSEQRTKTWKESNDPDFEGKKTAFSTSTKRPQKAEWSSASTSAVRSN